MNSYILFVFANFDDREDVEYFLDEILGESKKLKNLKFIVDDLRDLIIIFDSNSNHKEISEELSHLLKIEQIKFYFLFVREGLIIANLSPEIKNYFKLKEKNENIFFNVDELLDKIKKYGLESLTPEEKKYLDNFEN